VRLVLLWNQNRRTSRPDVDYESYDATFNV
jgi:hypothetical protein